jgi:hypothetical protein
VMGFTRSAREGTSLHKRIPVASISCRNIRPDRLHFDFTSVLIPFSSGTEDAVRGLDLRRDDFTDIRDVPLFLL